MTTDQSPARPFVSVLLPVRGESAELLECLASLASQTYPRDRFEVLIADASDTPVDPTVVPAGLDAHIYPNPARVMSPGLNMLATDASTSVCALVGYHEPATG